MNLVHAPRLGAVKRQPVQCYGWLSVRGAGNLYVRERQAIDKAADDFQDSLFGRKARGKPFDPIDAFFRGRELLRGETARHNFGIIPAVEHFEPFQID
jgi:hypothetical protein